MKWIVPLAMSLVLGCAPEAPIPGAFDKQGEVEVTVDGQTITTDMLEAVISHMPAKQKEALMNDEAQKKRFVESYLVTELLYREAVAADFHKDKDVLRNLAMANRHILANMYLNQIGENAVTDEVIQAKYDENKVKYGRPQTHIHHIMVREKDLGERLVAEINAGADFAEVAKKHDPRARTNGGDLGWVGRAPIPELEKALSEGPINEAVGPFESRMGFHIIKVEARRDSTPIEDVRDELAQMVSGEARKTRQTDIKNDAKIVYPGEEKADDKPSTPQDTPTDAPATDAPAKEAH